MEKPLYTFLAIYEIAGGVKEEWITAHRAVQSMARAMPTAIWHFYLNDSEDSWVTTVYDVKVVKKMSVVVETKKKTS